MRPTSLAWRWPNVPQLQTPLPNWWDSVKAAMRAKGVPVEVWLPILLAESTGNPAAHNTGTPKVPEDSVGLFQLNRKGGQGAGYTVEQLMNPAINAEIASRFIAQGMQICQAKGDGSIQCVAVNSGHPGNVSPGDKRVVWIAQLADAVKQGSSDLEKWASGRKKTGEGPTETEQPGGGSWLPSGADFGKEFWTGFSGAAYGSLVQGLAAKLGYKDAADIGWAITFGAAGIVCLWTGLLGLAVTSGAVSQVTKTVATIVPNPAVKAASATVSAVTTPTAPPAAPAATSGQGLTRGGSGGSSPGRFTQIAVP